MLPLDSPAFRLAAKPLLAFIAALALTAAAQTAEHGDRQTAARAGQVLRHPCPAPLGS